MVLPAFYDRYRETRRAKETEIERPEYGKQGNIRIKRHDETFKLIFKTYETDGNIYRDHR